MLEGLGSSVWSLPPPSPHPPPRLLASPSPLTGCSASLSNPSGRTQKVLFTCRVPSLWAQVEVEAGKCRVESGLLGAAMSHGGDEDQGGDDDGAHKRRKSEHGGAHGQRHPGAAEIAAAAAVLYQAVLEQVVQI